MGTKTFSKEYTLEEVRQRTAGNDGAELHNTFFILKVGTRCAESIVMPKVTR